MGVFKNGVGRPSNETIKKRNIFKVICVLLILVIIVLIGYILNDKNVDNKEPKTTTKNVNKTDSKYKNFKLGCKYSSFPLSALVLGRIVFEIDPSY